MSKTRTVKFSLRRPLFQVILAACSLAVASGCQSFAPGSLAGLSSFGADSRIRKEAQNEPFPSPADVGLAGASASL